MEQQLSKLTKPISDFLLKYSSSTYRHRADVDYHHYKYHTPYYRSLLTRFCRYQNVAEPNKETNPIPKYIL